MKIGLNPIPGVSCLYTDDFLTVLLYVDNIIVIHTPRDELKCDGFEDKRIKTYETKPHGQIHNFLAIRAIRDEIERKILVSTGGLHGYYS